MRRLRGSVLVLLNLMACAHGQERVDPPLYPRQFWVKDRPVLVSRDPFKNRGQVPAPWNESLPASLTWIHPMWSADTAWALGFPSSVALDRIEASFYHVHLGWDLNQSGSNRPNPLRRSLPQYLYRKAPGEAWRKVGRYDPSEDPHGPFIALEALNDGRFAAFAPPDRWFVDQNQASPCARYALDAGGTLRFQNLVHLLKDAPLPARRPTPETSPESPWLDWGNQLRWAISSQTILVASDRGCLGLLDARDGRLLGTLRLPGLEKAQRYLDLILLPAPDGTFWIVAAQPEGSGGNEVQRRPGGALAAGRLGMKKNTVPSRLVAFHLDPATGRLEARPLPPGVPARLADHQELANLNATYAFLVGVLGQLELQKRRLF